ncbi:MAG: SDR family NAD(P)-dependent oxidoreductase [Rhodospirillales bacterium]|jgi:2-hydroxycyclohexanecarboxyl-CoA dehydrogenase|nr:SDR family NAD(P)-dependent oxidoreductase [Rhodospirillales bacterium]
MKLNDKIAVVTGAASGIGQATANAMAEAGGTVYLCDINEEGGEVNAKAIRDNGGQATFVRVDVTDDASIADLAKQVDSEAGRLDVLANVAGWGKTVPFVDTEYDFWEKVVDLNLYGPIKMCKAFVPGMFERKSGRIVNVASDAGRVGSLGETVYSGAKGGVIGFTKGLAREGARNNVTVNCVCPGPTDTPLMAPVPEKITEAFIRATPMRRLAKPEELANAILFFASDRASFCTGQVLSVSGGLTMHG